MQIGELQQQSFSRSFQAGWWDEQTAEGAEYFTPETPMPISVLLDSELVQKTIPEKLALIHSEVSEALEDYRDGNLTADLDERIEDEAWLTVLVALGQSLHSLNDSYEWLHGEALQIALVRRLTDQRSPEDLAGVGEKVHRFLFATANRLATTPRPQPKPVGLPTDWPVLLLAAVAGLSYWLGLKSERKRFCSFLSKLGH